MTEKKKAKPLTIETIYSTATEKSVKGQKYEKNVITGSLPVPEGHVRCIVLVAYQGMLDYLYKEDVIDLPDRRYKQLAMRGFVKKYEGPRIPNKQR
jgi:hypothetical protein